ncbi:DUF502 domain-containing protein [Halomicrobium katesii]|uniref:DUF502 domain-containing protein n=1 Tax=Halomicrobium katesii TaxID=437163 RepID=UPI000378A7D3|nr:DUF502 domain-containing protein [Halomicrobium katesii]
MASATWKRDFASGLIILLPLLVTVYVLAYLYGILASLPLANVITPGLLAPLLNIPVEHQLMTQLVTFVRVLTTLAVFVLLVFSIGYLMRTAFGDVIEQALDDLMNQVPGLRVVYNASKMAVETAVSGADELQTPVKLEVWDGLRMTAFKTGQQTEDGRDVLFLPTAPNITTGYVIEVDPDAYEETDERVEDALTRILSAGFGDAEENHTQVPAGLVNADDD